MSPTPTTQEGQVPLPKLYDCVPLFDELDLLEVRLQELDSVVDRFLIAESPETHAGADKPLYLTESLEREPERWARWRDRMQVLVVHFPVCKDPWDRERFQRDSLMRGLGWTDPWDLILCSDLDEIPRAEAVRAAARGPTPCRFVQRFSYYGWNIERTQPWTQGSSLCRRVQLLSLSILRHFPNQLYIPNGGWHCSFYGGPEQIQRKLRAYAHTEYGNPEFTARERIEERIRKVEDLFDRGDHQWRRLSTWDHLPDGVQKNRERWSRFWIPEGGSGGPAEPEPGTGRGAEGPAAVHNPEHATAPLLEPV